MLRNKGAVGRGFKTRPLPRSPGLAQILRIWKEKKHKARTCHLLLFDKYAC
ncbi:hypothetical protein Ga0080574_TMP2397 [Salipiger abyssi]|uniref:Uncharacterized protein n=1 Tax=Salipiger abyssi TaxID=1250539 RepID=A0A1P8UTM6_9RHOB|nr:hypothetical protein Ga0080574_TMP2397 [Salipiger abyssi]